MKVRVISLDNRGFHDKLSKKTIESIENAGHQIAFEGNPDLIHYVRVSSLSEFADIKQDIPFSFLMMGFSYQLRNPAEISMFMNFMNNPKCHRIIIMTIHPSSLRDKLSQVFGKLPPKVIITDEPPYETKEFYRSVTAYEARDRIGVSHHTRMCLYFGSYFYSKGADILLKAVRELPKVKFFMVGDTKLTSFDYDIKTQYQLPNVTWVDGYVTEEQARDYFRACALVILPYRKFYEHDTSGVYNQAMLAERLVIVPDISPFTNLFRDYGPSHIFAYENPSSLAETIECYGFTNNWKRKDFNEYLDAQRGWESIGESL